MAKSSVIAALIFRAFLFFPLNKSSFLNYFIKNPVTVFAARPSTIGPAFDKSQGPPNQGRFKAQAKKWSDSDNNITNTKATNDWPHLEGVTTASVTYYTKKGTQSSRSPYSAVKN
jgi:hypothetical protein